MKLSYPVVSIALVLTAFADPDAFAAGIDWSKVETEHVKVFYPGVASLEFLTSEDHGRGAAQVARRQKACTECHVGGEGEVDIKADQIIKGELVKSESEAPFEPSPTSDASGFKDVTFQAAYDAQNIYLRFQWPGSGASVADPALADEDKPDRIAVQIARKIGTFKGYGCFITCHDDQSGMPGNDGSEVTLYGYYTRNGDGSVKDQATLDGYLQKEQFIDLLEVGFAGNDVRASDMYILDARHEDNNDLTATGSYEDGTYTVIIQRKLDTGNPGDITLMDGEDFDMGIAIHDDQHNGRQHYTSFPVSVGLSGEADVVARKF